MAGTLVAEALANGDLGIAVAALAPGSVATAISLWGTDEQQATYLPAFTGDDAAGRGDRADRADHALRRARSGTTATRADDGFVLDGVKSMVPRGADAELFVVGAASRAATRCSSSRPAPTASSVEADPSMGVRAASLTRLSLTGGRAEHALLGE